MKGTKPFPTSAFADEASTSLTEQIEALVRNDIDGLDLRSVEETNVLELEDDQLDEVRQACEEAGKGVATIGSPVNKVAFSKPERVPQLNALDRAIRAAERVQAPAVRIFTPQVEPRFFDELWPELLSWMTDMVRVAEQNDVLLLHENDAKYFGAYPENARRLMESLGGDHFKFAFDFANTVGLGYSPLQDWIPWLSPYLHTLHLKDMKRETGKIVPVGEGDGEVAACLKQLVDEGWSGTLTLEPHLERAGKFGGYSGPERFDEAAKAMRKVMSEAGIG
jgi:sugar phosphate isomerase/epimerase